MTRCSFLKKTVLVLCVLTLCLLPTAQTFADSWHPPDGFGSMMLCQSMEGGRTVSLFLSNFAETGLTAYDGSASDSVVNNCVLKHMELNASQFSPDVKILTDTNGQQYMTIPAERFQRRAQQMFGRAVSAAGCPGYLNGQVVVRADNANAPIRLVALPDHWIGYEGNYRYSTAFTVYRVDEGSPSALYGYADMQEDTLSQKATKLYTGSVKFEYRGDPDATSFDTWDLHLISYSTSGAVTANSGYFGDNIAYVPGAGSAAATVPAETLTETVSDVPEESRYGFEETTAEAPVYGTMADDIETTVGRAAGRTDKLVSAPMARVFLYILLGVAVLGLIALIVILVVMKK
ncbi:MAG: hypothetical protein IJJ85_11230 [Clostridia bacterium]|nr:hypothetical protein [Clostridia bacterium]